jgi:hypothetical protein
VDHTVFDFEYFLRIVVLARRWQIGVPTVEVPSIEQWRPGAVGPGRGRHGTSRQNRPSDTQKNAFFYNQQAKILLDDPAFVIKPGHTRAYAN